MIIAKGKTNWIYIAVVFVSAAITGAYLMFYINGEVVLGADSSYSQSK